MGRRTVITDDFTGSDIEETEVEEITFSVGGAIYRMEVGAQTRTKFMTALKPFITKGDEGVDEETGIGPFRRPVGARIAGTAGASASSSPTSEKREWLNRVRAWARSAGHDVKDKGRLPANVIEAYVAQHGDDPEPA